MHVPRPRRARRHRQAQYRGEGGKGSTQLSAAPADDDIDAADETDDLADGDSAPSLVLIDDLADETA